MVNSTVASVFRCFCVLAPPVRGYRSGCHVDRRLRGPALWAMSLRGREVDLKLPIVQSGESSACSCLKEKSSRSHFASTQLLLLLLLSLSPSPSPSFHHCQTLLDSLFLLVKLDEVVISSLIVLQSKVLVIKYYSMWGILLAFLSILDSFEYVVIILWRCLYGGHIFRLIRVDGSPQPIPETSSRTEMLNMSGQQVVLYMS